MKRLIFSLVVAAAIAVSAVVVTSCGNAQAQGGGSAQSVRWEYKVVVIGDTSVNSNAGQIEVQLKNLGAEGWELVSVTSPSSSFGSACAFLKRRI
jgi:hypothetical protein